MRPRLIALAVAAFALAALLALFLHQRSRPVPATTPLTSLAPAAVTRLSVQAQGAPGLLLVRTAAGWRMEAPVRAHADPDRVAALLDGLREATTRHYSKHALALPDIGLAPPQLVLRANGIRLEFGTLNPATLLRYVRRGDTVFLVMDRLLPLLQTGPWQFVDPHPVPQDARIIRIVLPRSPQPIAPHFIAAWENAVALRVEPLEPRMAQTAPKILITLAGHSTPLIFAVLARTPYLELARPDIGVVYVFDTHDADTLLASTPATNDARTPGSRNYPPRT